MTYVEQIESKGLAYESGGSVYLDTVCVCVLRYPYSHTSIHPCIYTPINPYAQPDTDTRMHPYIPPDLFNPLLVADGLPENWTPLP